MMLERAGSLPIRVWRTYDRVMNSLQRLTSSLLLVGLALVVGCGDDSTEPGGETGGELALAFDPAGGDFYSVPWPSNHRLLADGTVDLHDFPLIDTPWLSAVRSAIEGHVAGFSPMPAGYFALDRHPGDAVLLTPAQSLASDATVKLVAVDGGHCGEVVPVEMQISTAQEDGIEDRYLPPNVLQITPVPGFALRQGIDYAFVVSKRFGAPAGLVTPRPAAWDAALSGADPGPIADSLEPLKSCAAEGGLDLDDVALATVFVVQDVLGRTKAMCDEVQDAAVTDAPVLSGWAVNDTYTKTGRTAYTATYETPIFQTGVSPYGDPGSGDIVFDADGRPQIQRLEEVPMILLVPDGAGPFPVLIWVDGTGWGQWDHVSSSLTQAFLGAGFAVASYMPQFHGDRASPGSDYEYDTYNFTNPSAGGNALRQQIADTAYFVRVLTEAIPALPDPPSLDTSHLVAAGQSQGAQNVAMAAAVVPEINTVVANGLAGFLTITVLERKDMLDFEALIKALLGIYSDIDRFHPTLQLVQLGADPVDPQNFAAGWRGWAGKPEGANLFVLNGLHDDTTGLRGIEAVTIAGDLAPVAPPGWDVDPFGVWDREPEPLPIQGNRDTEDGGSRTQATYLDADSGHFTIYDRSAERARAVAFLVDALTHDPPTLAP